MEYVGNPNAQKATKEAVIRSHTILAITQDGREMSQKLVGKTKLGLVLAHLEEYSPQSAQEICDGTEVPLQMLRQCVRLYPSYFQVRSE